MRFLSHRVEAKDIRTVAEAFLASEKQTFKSKEAKELAIKEAIDAITDNLRCDPALLVCPLDEQDIADLEAMSDQEMPQTIDTLPVLSAQGIVLHYASGIHREVLEFLEKVEPASREESALVIPEEVPPAFMIAAQSQQGVAGIGL